MDFGVRIHPRPCVLRGVDACARGKSPSQAPLIHLCQPLSGTMDKRATNRLDIHALVLTHLQAS